MKAEIVVKNALINEMEIQLKVIIEEKETATVF